MKNNIKGWPHSNFNPPVGMNELFLQGKHNATTVSACHEMLNELRLIAAQSMESSRLAVAFVSFSRADKRILDHRWWVRAHRIQRWWEVLREILQSQPTQDCLYIFASFACLPVCKYFITYLPFVGNECPLALLLWPSYCELDYKTSVHSVSPYARNALDKVRKPVLGGY